MATARADDEALRQRALRVVQDLETRGLGEDAAVVRDLMARVEAAERGRQDETVAAGRTYSIAEAAYIMGIPESLAAAWCEQGRLGARRDEMGAWRVPASRFLVTLEHAQAAEGLMQEIERERRASGIPDVTDEEFADALRRGEEEDRGAGSAQ